MSRVATSNRILGCAVLCVCCAWQSASGADLPKRKAGQWEIVITSDNPNIASRTEDVCLDEATDALLYKFALGASQQMCSKYDWKNLGGGKVSVDATCKLGATQVAIRGDITFTGNTAYREDIKTHFEPPLRGRGDSTSIHDAKWAGPCAAGMKPGDVVSRPSPMLPTGLRINLKEMLKDEAR